MPEQSHKIAPEIFERLKRMAAQRRAQMQGTPGATTDLELNPDRRAENLRLLRAYMDNSTQDQFRTLIKISSQSAYSNYERGEPILPASEARRIESELELPVGWLERNNTDAMFLTQDELALVLELKQCAPHAASSLLNAVRSIKAQRG